MHPNTPPVPTLQPAWFRFAVTGGTPVNWRVPFSTSGFFTGTESHASHLRFSLSAVLNLKRGERMVTYGC